MAWRGRLTCALFGLCGVEVSVDDGSRQWDSRMRASRRRTENPRAHPPCPSSQREGSSCPLVGNATSCVHIQVSSSIPGVLSANHVIWQLHIHHAAPSDVTSANGNGSVGFEVGKVGNHFTPLVLLVGSHHRRVSERRFMFTSVLVCSCNRRVSPLRVVNDLSDLFLSYILNSITETQGRRSSSSTSLTRTINEQKSVLCTTSLSEPTCVCVLLHPGWFPGCLLPCVPPVQKNRALTGWDAMSTPACHTHTHTFPLQSFK